jgi:hypothetical protein
VKGNRFKSLEFAEGYVKRERLCYVMESLPGKGDRGAGRGMVHVGSRDETKERDRS